jgi:DNA-directed RNA polymerase subunit RPC12/RpoP/uncharacterized membrane protein
MARKPPGATAIRHAIEQRDATDRTPSYFTFVVLPVLLVLVGLLAAVGLIVGIAGGLAPNPVNTINRVTDTVAGGAVAIVAIAVITAIVLTLIGLYRIVQRREDHLARDALLREGLLDFTEWLADTHDADSEREHLDEMRRLHRQARLEERERNGVLHLLVSLFLFPLWYLYVVYYLQRDFASHARRQARFVREAREVFTDAGYEEGSLPNVPPIQDRSVAVSWILLVLLGPIGALIVHYWLFSDPADHFQRQWIHEDALETTVKEARPGSAEPSEQTTSTDADESEPDEPDAGDEATSKPGPEPPAGDSEETGPPEPDADTDEDTEASEPSADGEAEQAEPAPEPEMTIWACGECSKKYKVPPQRPVRVTCKDCGNEEILEE